MRHTLLLTVLAPLCLLVPASSQTSPQCKVQFSVLRKDALNNIQQGLVGDDLKWMQTKMAQKYPDLCYVSSTSSVPVVFFISLSKDTYHGTRTVSETHTNQGTMEGTVTDTTPGSGTYGQQVGTVSGTTQNTTTTDREVPYSFPYTVLALSVETPESDGTWKLRHNFQNDSIQHQLYGIAVTNRHPYHSLIEQAMQWVHSGGLDSMTQSVAAPQDSQSKVLSAPTAGGATSPAASPAITRLSLSSNPQGAEIELDGSFVGSTPSEISIAEGDHTIRITKTGFKSWERRLKATAGSTVHIDSELEKAHN